MKIALFGYGRMGKAVEEAAKERGHSIGYINTGQDIDVTALKECDVVVEFTQPDAAAKNIVEILSHGVPVVCGTTGWLEQKAKADHAAVKGETGFLYASNFSLGVNLFFVMNEKLAAMMSGHPEYTPKVHEIHHTGKKDAPSGTGITTAEGILMSYPKLKNWTMDPKENGLLITADRIDPYFGTHVVSYESEIDTIKFEHEAHSRKGFALGAVIAAEWLPGHVGSFGMRDVLGL
jgi:4-hydroxy-tetrahydrodipicolinate reductase